MVPSSNDVEEEWSNIQDLLKKVGNEVLGKNGINTQKRGLKICNKEIEHTIQEKQSLSQIPSDKNQWRSGYL